MREVCGFFFRFSLCCVFPFIYIYYCFPFLFLVHSFSICKELIWSSRNSKHAVWCERSSLHIIVWNWTARTYNHLNMRICVHEIRFLVIIMFIYVYINIWLLLFRIVIILFFFSIILSIIIILSPEHTRNLSSIDHQNNLCNA